MFTYDLIIFLLFFVYFRWNKSFHLNGLSNWAVSGAFLLKVIAGSIFVYIYTFYYGNGELSEDAGVYLRESKILRDVFHESPSDYFKLLFGLDPNGDLTLKYLSETSHWDIGSVSLLNDNRFFIKLNSLIQFFSFGQVYVHIIVLCAISTIAVKNIYLAIERHTFVHRTFIYWILLLIPSIIFWTSGIAKESMMYLGFALFLRGILDNRILKFHKLFLISIGALLLLVFKAYVLLAFVPTFLFYWSYKLFPKFKLINASLILIAITAIASIAFSEKRGNFVHLLTRKQYDFNNVALGGIHAHLDSTFYFFSTDKLSALQIESDSIKVIKPVTAVAYKHGDISHPREVDFLPNEEKMFIYFQNFKCKGYLETTPINNSSLQLLLNSPEALINALFRPVIGDVGGKLKYFATIEIAIIYLLLLFAIFKRRKLNDEQKNNIYSALIFIISLSLLIGWVTPVIGAIARYRLPVLVGLIFIALVLINPNHKLKRNE